MQKKRDQDKVGMRALASATRPKSAAPVGARRSKRLGIYIAPELLRRLKLRAIDEGCNLSDLAEHAFRKYLGE